MVEEEAMNVGELREIVMQDPAKIFGYGKYINAGTSSIQGSAAYWAERRGDLCSMVRYLLL